MSSWFDDLKTPRFKGEPQARVAKVPEGLWGKCPQCGEIIQTRQLQDNLSVCAECDHHLRISAVDRVLILTDENSFVSYGDDFKSNDPLQFDDSKPYRDRLAQSMKSHKLNDAFANSAEVGFAFHPVGRGRIFNTFDAHRLLHWAEVTGGADTQLRLKKALLNAYQGRGEVIDWIELPNWPVFNIADSAIVCAGIVMTW
ncbi:MAG: hypothetical protein EBX52_01910, partial [Proteobacteria bacterium]|nr:hypothetical protein [Pseudomonadota bacterium]